MKRLQLFCALSIIIYFQACNEKTETSEQAAMDPNSCCYRMHNGDTINKEVNGRKQGHFIIYEEDLKKPGTTAYTIDTAKPETVRCATCPGKKLEEGYYKDNKKEGTWTYYTTDGTVQKTVEFKEGKEIAK